MVVYISKYLGAPALAADDARGGDEEDRGGENEQDAEAGEDPDHLFYNWS